MRVAKKNLRFPTRSILYDILTDRRNSYPLRCTGLQFYDPRVLIFPFFEMTILLQLLLIIITTRPRL